jgi:hypothetical protein
MKKSCPSLNDMKKAESEKKWTQAEIAAADEESFKQLEARRKKSDGPGSRSNQHYREQVASGKKSKWESQYKPSKGPEKGVHRKASGLSPDKHGGTSEAGAYVKGNKAKARDYDFQPEPRKVQLEEAKKEHLRVINEQKNMKAPNLPKSELASGKSLNDMKKSEDLNKGPIKNTVLAAALAAPLLSTNSMKGTLFSGGDEPHQQVTRSIAGEPAHEHHSEEENGKHEEVKTSTKEKAKNVKERLVAIRNQIKGME